MQDKKLKVFESDDYVSDYEVTSGILGDKCTTVGTRMVALNALKASRIRNTVS